MTTDSPDPAAPAGIRNATLGDLAAMLRDQQARKLDIVAPASAIRARHGQLVLDGTDPQLGPDGVTMTTGTYTPTDVCDQGLADKLAIPAPYLRRMRDQRPALYDTNVNGWLDHDPRKFLIRCLRPTTGTGPGAARAFLSDGYKRIDNLDVLMAALDGVRQAGSPVEIDGCDLTERRMYVRVVCEQISALAPALLDSTPPRSPSPSSGPAHPASPVPWPCSSRKSTPPRPPFPATPALSPTSSRRRPAFNTKRTTSAGDLSPDTAPPSGQPQWHHNVLSGATLAAAPVGTARHRTSHMCAARLSILITVGS
jgi:hypothetical protein